MKKGGKLALPCWSVREKKMKEVTRRVMIPMLHYYKLYSKRFVNGQTMKGRGDVGTERCSNPANRLPTRGRVYLLDLRG
jgi:hypothetical protein